MILVGSALAGLFALYFIFVWIYRLTLHPLAKYPGSWQRAISNWPQAFSHFRGDGHVDLQRLHEKYGDVVRIAPDTLAFRSAKAVHDIYDRKANVIKTGFTDASLATNPHYHTQSLNDRQLHAKRRRLLANAFSEKALQNLEPFIIDRVQAFCNIMGEAKTVADPVPSEKDTNWSKARDISDWANNLTLDILGELCFGKTFGALEAGGHMAAEFLLSSSWTNHVVSSTRSFTFC